MPDGSEYDGTVGASNDDPHGREGRMVYSKSTIAYVDPDGGSLPPWTPGAHVDLQLGDLTPSRPCPPLLPNVNASNTVVSTIPIT